MFYVFMCFFLSYLNVKRSESPAVSSEVLFICDKEALTRISVVGLLSTSDIVALLLCLFVILFKCTDSCF